MSTNKQVSVIKKNQRDVIVVSIGTLNNRSFIDIRVCFPVIDGSLCPTRKGISFSLDKAEEIKRGIDKAVAEMSDPKPAIDEPAQE